MPLLKYIEVLEKCMGKTANTQILLQAGDVPDTEAYVSELAARIKYEPKATVGACCRLLAVD